MNQIIDAIAELLRDQGLQAYVHCKNNIKVSRKDHNSYELMIFLNYGDKIDITDYYYNPKATIHLADPNLIQKITTICTEHLDRLTAQTQ
jgi:hypothetical protein